MDYQQTIDYLFTKLPMFSRIGAAAFKKDLTNTIALCDFLDNPQSKFKSIHVAGTNGKGSVSHMLAAILQTAGYKTGLYTSPHLKDFRERIRVNGKMVAEKFVIDFTEKIKPLIRQIEPSFFEITVAMAFDYFAREKVDIAIIEVGLGGRLDSTNIITPELSVITNIGWDHMNMLGDSLEKIAFEKAGVIKEQVPVVIGETLPETLSIFSTIAKEKDAPLSFASQTRQVMDWRWEKNELVIEVADAHRTDHKKYHLDLPGIYQTRNLLTVLEACSQLQQRGWNIDEPTIQLSLKQVKKMTGLHGRWEVIHHSPTVVLDVAHNIDGISQLLQQIELTGHQELHIIIGMVKDKEIDDILSVLPKEAHYYFTKAGIPRALPEEQLQKRAAQFKLKGKTFSTVNTALYAASLNACKEDLVIVCGSIFLVGEISLHTVREIWGKEPYSLAAGFFEMLGGIGH
ncbi:MAG: bifunctional folylpolyglutamate synthase/dihydrofolate synthase [Chitinophagaceae bacterium]|nr:bifunctional folylpolyglutamate synthase/dihydrofolate synthase [Chitinophagaceae bacterium]